MVMAHALLLTLGLAHTFGSYLRKHHSIKVPEYSLSIPLSAKHLESFFNYKLHLTA